MFKIFSQTDKKKIFIPPGSTILDAARTAKINHMHVCGGNARCTTCRVDIRDGLKNCQCRNEKENKIAEKLEFPDNIRLACQTKINGNISISRPVVDDLDVKIILRQFGDTPGPKLGQEKDLTILFTDIVNYTSFAEAFPAYDVVHVLNRYYQTMNEIILQNKGVISDVAGDGILSLFGVMKDSTNTVLDAINTVRGMQSALIQFNRYLNHMYGRSFGIRSGISYGKVIVGNFDTGMMNKISAIGDLVNLASRIESANKDFGTQILISQSAFEKIKGAVKIHKVYRSKLKGKSGEYLLYNVEI